MNKKGLDASAESSAASSTPPAARVQKKPAAKATLKRNKATAKPKANSKMPRWQKLHLEYYSNANLQWPPPDGALHDDVRSNRRELEVMYYFEKTLLVEEGISEIFIDASQGINRISPEFDCVPCVCPGSIIVWMKKSFQRSKAAVRVLLAPELLQLQFVSLHDFEAVENFPPRQVADLAGNAFCGVAAIVSLVAAVTAYSVPSLRKRRELCIGLGAPSKSGLGWAAAARSSEEADELGDLNLAPDTATTENENEGEVGDGESASLSPPPTELVELWPWHFVPCSPPPLPLRRLQALQDSEADADDTAFSADE